MDLKHPLREVCEGGGRFLVPVVNITDASKGPGKKAGGMFYNPAMELDRNISVLFFSASLKNKDPHILDALCASGIRGIRYAREMSMLADTSPCTTLNDANRFSCELAERNALRNSLSPGENIHVRCGKAQAIMCEERFDIIDIDPYGPAVPFLDSAFQGIKHGGIISLTATDTATACGTYQTTCRRRYQATGLRNTLRHEAGLRIVIGHAVRRAAEQDMALEPMLGYWYDHYFRMFFTASRSLSRARKLLEHIFVGAYDPNTGEVAKTLWNPAESAWDTIPKTRGATTFGPYWTGEIINGSTISTMKSLLPSWWDRTDKTKATARILDILSEEAGMPPFFRDTNDIGKMSGVVPKRADIINRLKEAGFAASRTHFSPTGIKTNAATEMLAELSKNPQTF